MLLILTHPWACLVYFVALAVGLHKLLGDPRSSLGFLGRALLFAAGSLAVFAAAVLSWVYQLNGPPEVIRGLVFIPGTILLLAFLGTLVAMVTARPREVFPVTLGIMSAILFLVLLRECPY